MNRPPRERYAVVSVRAGDLELVVGLELRAGEAAEAVYELGRAATSGARRLTGDIPDEFLAGLVEAWVIQNEPGRDYYIEVGHHSELVERPEYRYHVQLYQPWSKPDGRDGELEACIRDLKQEAEICSSPEVRAGIRRAIRVLSERRPLLKENAT